MTPYSPAARIQPRYILACTTRYAASPMRKYGTFKPRDANRFGVAVHVKQTKSWTGADALFFSLCFLFFSSSPLRTTNVRSLLHFTLYGLLFDPVRSRYIPRVHSPRQRRPYERWKSSIARKASIPLVQHRVFLACQSDSLVVARSSCFFLTCSFGLIRLFAGLSGRWCSKLWRFSMASILHRLEKYATVEIWSSEKLILPTLRNVWNVN